MAGSPAAPVLATLLAPLLLGGWLADALAAKDADVDRGIAAHEAGEYDEALGHYATARERLGDRPEILFDEGLAQLAKGDNEAAQKSFERGTESEDLEIRASALYELGNMALTAEDWEGAIARYIECLKARPDHANAKWNLELALQRKQEQEDPEQNEEQDTEGSDEGGGTDGEPPPQDTEGDDQQPPPDEQDQGTGGQPDPSDSDGESEPPPDDSGEDGQEDQQEQPPPEPSDDESQGQPQPLDRMDIDRALEQLDAQDNFQMGRPSGRRAPPEKDW